MRYAINFTPARDAPLTLAASAWLGRDAFTDERLPAPCLATMNPEEISYHTAAARRYGFHATLKAPFSLSEQETELSLMCALDSFAGRARSFHIPRLGIARIAGLFALVPVFPVPELSAFADDVVRSFERFRAPLSDAEIARRNPGALTPAEVRNLVQWGYPYVLEAYRFHMPLTGRVPASESQRVQNALDEVFSPILGAPVLVNGVSVFVEREPGAPFTVLRYRLFGSPAGERQIAEPVRRGRGNADVRRGRTDASPQLIRNR